MLAKPVSKCAVNEMDVAIPQLNRDPDVAPTDLVLNELLRIRSEIVAEADQSAGLLDRVHPSFRESSKNLLHYLALRRRDIRPLQLRLAALGLSSLGRSESHVLANIDATLEAAHKLAGKTWDNDSKNSNSVDFSQGQELLSVHAEDLLGPTKARRSVRIMVTLPSESAQNYTLIHDLLSEGMDCARINCAHDDPGAWLKMIEHLRRAEVALGKSCRVVMDLAGPKLRTGPLTAGAKVVKVKPKRDVFGRVTLPARLWVTSESAPVLPPSFADVTLPVSSVWIKSVRAGGTIRFTDARGAQRSFSVVDVIDDGFWAEARDTSYLVPGTKLYFSKPFVETAENVTEVGEIPPRESFLTLKTGDELVITRDIVPGREATRDSGGRILTPATIGCTIPEVFDDARSGESIWFDDGKIGGVIERIEDRKVMVRIVHAGIDGSKLRADKGINLPESALRLSALTEKDIEDLAFICENADAVGLSFANSAADVDSIHGQIDWLGTGHPAIILKIETQRGFEHLPDMLLAAMESPCCGVMIARGDLAVECGFERLAEVQEQILWICEAAHVPVIWATQVLETLAKEGMPSRAEITDAAMGHRAECVMLNKGPHVLHAVRSLDDILTRMQAHQTKKQAMLRELHLAHTIKKDR